MAGTSPAIHVLQSQLYARRLGLYPDEQAGRHSLYRGDAGHRAPRLGASRGHGAKLHTPLWREAARVVRASRHDFQRDSTREKHEALAASLEGAADPRHEPRMGRSLRDAESV